MTGGEKTTRRLGGGPVRSPLGSDSDGWPEGSRSPKRDTPYPANPPPSSDRTGMVKNTQPSFHLDEGVKDRAPLSDKPTLAGIRNESSRPPKPL